MYWELWSILKAAKINPQKPGYKKPMRKNVLILISVLGFGISAARSQTLLNSWENSLEGWTISEPGIWSTAGFSKTTGVTAGVYSWELTAASGPDYNTALTGPSSTALTSLLANAGSVSVDIDVPVGGSFGYYLQWDLSVNQPGGLGSVSVDGGNYTQAASIGGQATLTFTIPASVRAAMLANPSLPSYLSYAIGGGSTPGAMTIYLDNLRVSPLGLINSWENSQEGWTIDETNWTTTGFSTNTGVTAGYYSWELTAASGPDYGIALTGPASTNLTAELADTASIRVDVLTPMTGSFDNYEQWDLEVNQPGGAGTLSLDGGDYSQSPTIGGSESTLTWTMPQSIRTALLGNPALPASLSFKIGGGGAGTMYIDNLRATLVPPVPAQLSIRELWDDLGSGEEIPAIKTVTDDSSSVGFSATPWIVNPAETNNCELMAFRPGFGNEGSILMGLPGSLDGTTGCMLQENNGFNFTSGGNSFWTDGDFMTRELTPDNYINFQATGEYWFSMTIANSTASLDAQYVTFPASGAGGIGFADGTTTNANFVAVGVSGLNVYYGPTNSSNPFGETNASKALYISQGSLGQPGNLNSTVYNPLTDPAANPPDAPPNYAPPYNLEYTETNFTGGPYHINALGVQTVGNVAGDGIVVLGHLKTFGNGTATLDAKYYTVSGGNTWNYNLDTNPTNGITWDCSYSFSFGGTMTRMLLFENGQFPFYVFGFRASTNFSEVVGLDHGRIAVGPLTNTYVGYAINMTNLAVEANIESFTTPPSGYGTLNYQWYQNGTAISGATLQYLNIPSASLTDPAMPAGTDAGTYTSVATDPSGTWQPVTNTVTITVTQLNPPALRSIQMLHNQSTFLVTFDEPNLAGADNTNNYLFSGGITATSVNVFSTATTTVAQINTTPLPLGTKITLTISGVANVVGGALASTNEALWTDLIQTGAANWDAWQCAAGETVSAYFNTFVPANPAPAILQSMALTSWEGPSSGVTILGLDGYVGDDFGDKLYGWFVPPVTTNYVFFVSADDGCRLSLSTNSSSTNLFVIACDSDWNGADQWTNISDTYPSSPHRGDGTASGVGPTGYVWDNSIAAQSPATACDQNRSDQFIVAYWDSSGMTNADGEPAGATDQANWATAESQVSGCIPPGMTNFWPTVDANGQALITLHAGQMYYMQLEHIQNGGGYDESVTYSFAGSPDPLAPSSSLLAGSNIAGTAPFAPTIAITETPGGPVVTYTGVLLAGTSLSDITNVIAQSSASTAISLGGPSQYSPPSIRTNMFFRTSR
jgi:hypothetical protein